MMKRESREIDHSITMANYLMYLSHGSDDQLSTTSNSNNNRVFECKTCKRQFPSFQALGGHRASHKKPRLMVENNGEIINHHVLSSPTPIKPKRHECSICGLEFSIGQALGGHMRRHRSRGTNLNDNINYNNSNTTTTMSCSSGGSSLDSSTKIKDGKKRVLVLDLNLTPFENDLEILKIGNQGTHGAALVDYLY